MRNFWRTMPRFRSAAVALAVGGLSVSQAAYNLNPNSTDSIITTAKQLVADTIQPYYYGHLPGNEPGILPPPYYWWEGGALMGALINYWYYTNDNQYVNMTMDGLQAQVGHLNDYMPRAQILNEGNDDQGFWGMAVMSAAEFGFPNPPKDKPQWLALAQAVFNTQASRWDGATCGGGLRWQIFEWNNGYDYKNTISQACFFNVAARLALYTGNHSYAEWAERSWDWTVAVGFIDKDWNVYDGGHVPKNCTNTIPYQWTYNHGGFMHGVAAMYNYTKGAEQEKWRHRLEGLLNRSSIFFQGDNNDIMVEVPCEPVKLCNTDQQSFKAYFSRWLAGMTKWAPWTYDRVMPLLRASAVAATSQCTAGTNGRMCGHSWVNNGQNDGLLGLGQQMAALEVTIGLLAEHKAAPVTGGTGGTSQGDPAAGGGDMGRKDRNSLLAELPPISAGDRAGAYILTVATLMGLLTGIVFVLMPEADGKTWPERWSDVKRSIAGGGTALVAAGGMLRKSQQLDIKGNAVGALNVTAVSPTGSDTSVRAGLAAAERRSNSRVVLNPPVAGAGAHTPPRRPTREAQTSLQEQRITGLGHRRSRSAPAWDPELGLNNPLPPIPGEGFRRSATKQMGKSSLRKKSTGGAGSSQQRPASVNT